MTDYRKFSDMELKARMVFIGSVREEAINNHWMKKVAVCDRREAEVLAEMARRDAAARAQQEAE